MSSQGQQCIFKRLRYFLVAWVSPHLLQSSQSLSAERVLIYSWEFHWLLLEPSKEYLTISIATEIINKYIYTQLFENPTAENLCYWNRKSTCLLYLKLLIFMNQLGFPAQIFTPFCRNLKRKIYQNSHCLLGNFNRKYVTWNVAVERFINEISCSVANWVKDPEKHLTGPLV